MAELVRDNFEPYYTSVGGGGFGVLSPYCQHDPVQTAIPDRESPLETPISGSSSRDPDVDASESLKSAFGGQGLKELATWAEAQGRWLYV
jgi:hypothetical protein